MNNVTQIRGDFDLEWFSVRNKPVLNMSTTSAINASGPELYVAIMAGMVLSFFLMVGELAALRMVIRKIRSYLLFLYREAMYIKMLGVILMIASFFLIQPLIVGLLVVLALNNLNPDFSNSVLRELEVVLAQWRG